MSIQDHSDYLEMSWHQGRFIKTRNKCYSCLNVGQRGEHGELQTSHTLLYSWEDDAVNNLGNNF